MATILRVAEGVPEPEHTQALLSMGRAMGRLMKTFFVSVRDLLRLELSKIDKARTVFDHPELLEGTGWMAKKRTR